MTEKGIARKVLFAGFTLIVLAVVYFTFSMIGNNKRDNLDNLKSKHEMLVKRFEDIEPLQKLWYELKKIKRFNGNYKEFLGEYGKIQRSEILFHLAKNNDLYEEDLYDFRIVYYRQESALKYLYEMENSKSMEFKVFYDSIMTNESFTKKSYEMFILGGYSGSLTDFIQLMREEREYDDSLTYSSIKNIETEIEMNKTEQERIKNSIF